MFTVGDLIINNQIQVIVDTSSANNEMVIESNVYVGSSPVGSNHNLTPSYNGIVNYFQTDTAGDYSIGATVKYRNFSTGAIRTESQSVDFTIADQVFNQIEQTQTLVEATVNPCQNVGIQVDTNYPFSTINGQSIASTTSYVINKGRQEVLPIEVIASDQGTHGQSTVISSVTVPNMPLTIPYSLLFLDVEFATGYEYDFGSGYSTVNVHHYSTPGTKSVNVKDAYGCVRNVQFTATEAPVIDPADIPFAMYVSKANSLRYVRRDGDFDWNTVYPQDENTLDSEVPYLDLRYCHTQRVKTNQSLRTQFRSSGDAHFAEVVDANGNAEQLTVDLVQQNIGFLDQRNYLRTDDDVYSYIYFSDGKMPYFYQIGGTVTVNSEQRQILDLVYLDDLDVYALKLVLLTVAVGGSCDYTYNKQDYDVYEFVIPMALRQAGIWYVNLTAAKTGETDIVYRSANFDVQASFDQAVDILYFNDSNSDIYYKSGIKNYVTFGIESRKPISDSELTVVKADYTNYLRKSFITEKFEYKFEPLTLEMARKLEIALGHENLFIDSTGYACEGIEIETLEDTTNLYVIVAQVYKSDKNVKFITGGQVDFDWSSGQVTFDSSITIDRTKY